MQGSALFFRLLASEDKGYALAEELANIHRNFDGRFVSWMSKESHWLDDNVQEAAKLCYDMSMTYKVEPTTAQLEGDRNKMFLAGQNPYVENYVDTPLAEWGIEFHSAVYHYPYLPWTFVFSAPFYAWIQGIWGWFDQRLVYLVLFVLTLLMSLRLARTRLTRLLLVMVLGLNPIMGSDVIFGQNDSFVLFWIVLALWLLRLAEIRGITHPLTRAGDGAVVRSLSVAVPL
jgi:hypothetical protein